MAKNKQQTTLKRNRPFYKHPLFYIFIIIAIGFGIFFLIKRPEEPKLTDSTNSTSIAKVSTSTSSATNVSTVTPTESSTSATDNTVSPDGKTPEKYEGADPNNSESLTGSITTARFTSDKLIVRVNIDQYLSSGTCNLVLSDSTNQLEKTANLVPAASTSSCEGFDIPNAELANLSRPLNITITLISGDKRGTITGRAE